MIERDLRGPPPFHHDPMDGESGWPPAPRPTKGSQGDRRFLMNILERRRPPMGHDVMCRGPPPHDGPDRDMERGMYEQDYEEEFRPEDEYRRPPHNFPPRGV